MNVQVNGGSIVPEQKYMQHPGLMPQEDIKYCPRTCLITNEYNKLCAETKNLIRALDESGKLLSHHQLPDDDDSSQTEEVEDYNKMLIDSISQHL